MSTPPERTPPDWGHCGHGADPADPVGCRGIRVPGHTACLAHLSSRKQRRYLAGLAPGTDIDHRGTPFTNTLLDALLRVLSDPRTGQPRLGSASFDEATFAGDASFEGATFVGGGFSGARFAGVAWFEGATFNDAEFDEATFTGDASFGGARFTGAASFSGAAFDRAVRFGGATFKGYAGFKGATFSGYTSFGGATFAGGASFGGATFKGYAGFGGATFAVLTLFGPVVCWRQIDLSGAVFVAPVTMEIAAGAVCCVGTRWESKATLRLRYATVDLSDAVLSSPVTVTAHPTPFAGAKDDHLADGDLDPGVRVASVRGVDAAHLVLTDTDLTTCLFSGAVHLDQLRLEGRCTFAPTPVGLHLWHCVGLYRWVLPHRWTRRTTLADEHHWRAARAVGSPTPPRGWSPGSPHDRIPKPADAAATYRQLRKGLEDSKNEPGAADFYYGEMEMRRHDQTGTPRAARGLLWAYWLLSGYGLRALRAVGWLAATMALTVGLLMAFGLPPAPGPTQQSTLTVKPVGLSTAPVDPSGAAPSNWLTLPRFERATRTAVNSAVFRTAGEGLTTIGTCIEMASRFLEPTLLVLALLAVRTRVKR